MKIKTKILITLAILIATLNVFILVSSAEESTATVTVTDVEALNTAISDSNATYINLGADLTVDEPIIVSRNGITIDLNGHTITAYESENAYNNMLFKLMLEGINFEIKGCGKFDICRTLFDTVKAKNAEITVSATGGGITVTSPLAYSNSYFKVGTANYIPASMNVSGKLYVLHTAPSSAFEVYKLSTLNISNAEIIDDIHPDLFDIQGEDSQYIFKLVHAANLNINNSNITANNGCVFNLTNATSNDNPSSVIANSTSFYALNNGSIVKLNGASYSNMTYNKCSINYSNYAFCENVNRTLQTKYYLNVSLIDTVSLFSGTATAENALLSGKGITAVIDGGFHNLNGASLALKTIAYASNKGVLIKKGTNISCKFASNENIMVEDESSEIAEWYDSKTNGNLIAMGYYDSAQEAYFDISVIPNVITNNGLYNLKYTSWESTNTDNNGCIFTPNELTKVPTPALSGIKYNLSTYTNFSMNIYVPTSNYLNAEFYDFSGGFYDSNSSYSIKSTDAVIDSKEYMKFSFLFFASDMNSITMYAKYNVTYNGTVYALLQKISVSIIDYTEKILCGDDFSDIEKQLAADMLRYCNETIKLSDGSYNSSVSGILETHKEHLTDINNIQLENTDTNCKGLSHYIKEISLVFNSYEPKFAFKYTENVAPLSASEGDIDIRLDITYKSIDGNQKTAKTKIDTENCYFFISGISAYDINEILTVKVITAGEDKPLAEGTFSLATYISTLESPTVDLTFAKALYSYVLSSKAYKKHL